MRIRYKSSRKLIFGPTEEVHFTEDMVIDVKCIDFVEKEPYSAIVVTPLNYKSHGDPLVFPMDREVASIYLKAILSDGYVDLSGVEEDYSYGCCLGVCGLSAAVSL